MKKGDLVIIEYNSMLPEMQAHLDKCTSEGEAAVEYRRLAQLGLTVLEFVGNDKQVEFVKHEIDRLMQSVNQQIYDVASVFSNQVDLAMKNQFDPQQASSYVSQWHMAMQRTMDLFMRDIQGLAEKANNTTALMIDNAGKVSTDKVAVVEQLFRNADSAFDPANTNGYFGKFRMLLADLDTGLRQQLDRNFSTGFAGTLAKELETYFGQNSPVLGSMQGLLDKYMATIQSEMIALRESIARKEGELEMLQKASAKGGVFEDELSTVLMEMAKSMGETFQFTGNEKIGGSKKGDFIYNMGRSTIVIEAKDVANVGTKAMLRYMEEAMTVRNAEFGILCTRNLDQLEKQVGGMNVYGNVLFCHSEMLPLAMRWLRLYLTKIKGEEAKGADAAVIKAAISSVMTTMKSTTQVKQKLTVIRTNISTETEAIADLVDEMKNKVAKDLAMIEAEIGKG